MLAVRDATRFLIKFDVSADVGVRVSVSVCVCVCVMIHIIPTAGTIGRLGQEVV